MLLEMARPKVAQEFGVHVKSNDMKKLSSKEMMLASADYMGQTIASMVYTKTPVLWSHAMTSLLLKYIVRVYLSKPFSSSRGVFLFVRKLGHAL